MNLDVFGNRDERRSHFPDEDLLGLLVRVDVGVVAVAFVRQELHGRVLQIPHAESEDRQKDAAVTLVLDEVLELVLTRNSDVEISVGREHDTIDASLDEALGGDLVSELNALAS